MSQNHLLDPLPAHRALVVVPDEAARRQAAECLIIAGELIHREPERRRRRHLLWVGIGFALGAFAAALFIPNPPIAPAGAAIAPYFASSRVSSIPTTAEGDSTAATTNAPEVCLQCLAAQTNDSVGTPGETAEQLGERTDTSGDNADLTGHMPAGTVATSCDLAVTPLAGLSNAHPGTDAVPTVPQAQAAKPTFARPTDQPTAPAVSPRHAAAPSREPAAAPSREPPGAATAADAATQESFPTIPNFVRPANTAANALLEQRYADAWQLAQQGRRDAALSALQALLAEAPDHPKARLLLAELLLQQARPEEALAQLERGAVASEHGVTYHQLRVRTLQALAREADANAALAQALAQYPDAPELLALSALAALQSEQWNTALRYYQRLSDLQPLQPRWWLGLALAAERAGDAFLAASARERAAALGLPVAAAAQNLLGANATPTRTLP